MSNNPEVLLIGGPSSVGKSTAARVLGQRYGVPWLAVDDLRLALQELDRVGTFDMADEALHRFESTPDIWSRPVDDLRDAFVAIGRLLAPALTMIVRNHLAIEEPIIIEGDGILPEIVAHPDLAAAMDTSRMRVVFIVPGAADLIRNHLVRRGWADGLSRTVLDAQVAAKFAYGQWLAKEANRLGLPVLHPEPLATLVDRIEASVRPGGA